MEHWYYLHAKMVTIHSNYVLCARRVLVVTPDSSSRLPCCSMSMLPPPLLVINCLSCSPPGGSGPPPFPPPWLTPFPSGSRHLPASPSDTVKICDYFCAIGHCAGFNLCYGPQRRIWFSHFAIAQDLVLRHGLLHRIWFCTMGQIAKPFTTVQNHISFFKA
jgi:hypothetical protein